ncbi:MULTISPECIES: hydantoinase B/oxoprolinase family protein [Paenarthrobacter]|uniref:hydantoinase B/oxoprolinase family protein n=1 Tax=Paenarthrobacter TaxID=1742992 RepID=UPI00074D42F5|nr:hydantoinase B/oxoprolinase family protein [Paenarthrobacter ureafaciens]AMB40357.1 5-oxoprolinase [Arthrobacter sp. ATCC 21022]KUR63559.1 5-oxoprolinase [Arthrobacter sp. ATCC 21022]RWW91518.1 hydantoinase B/oxoprolinase family protein [Paenarthrobacter ureafaciens]
MSIQTLRELNAVELEIARNRLESISEEVGMGLIRTSYSPNIKDRRDCSAGIYGPDGELISQAEHIPLHLGLMPTLIRRALEEYGRERLVPGDVLITNNPYLGGSHLPDICVITPIFRAGEVVAHVANMAHHVDVGGATPGSMSTHSTEIFQEGIRIPPMRLFAAGTLQEEVLALLLMNMRTADKTRGDLMAQVAANRLGERRVGELVDEWGVEGFRDSWTALIDYSERRTRAAIANLPDGTGRFTDYLEHNGVRPDRLPIVAEVTVSGDEITVDFSESADHAAGAVNCSYAVAEACVAYAVKLLADPTLPSNAGLMAPITVNTRPGSLVAAEFPAPVANGNTQTSQRIVDAVLGAFHTFSHGIVPAASSGSMSIVTIGGIDHRTGGYFSYVETYGGGQGAMPDMDGASAVHTHMTNTRNTPCEVIEREYPLRVLTYEIAHGTGGAGRFTGGNGLVRQLALTGGSASVVAATARVAEGPWGLEGGSAGHPARVVRHDENGSHELEAMSRFELTAGQSILIQTAGGGGYGLPGSPAA